MNLRKLKVFIFDMDGTLVDSRLNFDLMREELGFPPGVPLLEHIETLRGEKDEQTIQSYFDVIHRHELTGAHESVLMPGIMEFLSFLNESSIKTAVVTRNSREVTDVTFNKWQLKFSQVLSRDCVENPKPHPEALLKVCENFGVEPEEAVYMGDFLFDLEAAHNAGMKAILYAPKHITPEEELLIKADVIVSCYKELKSSFSETFLKPLSFSLPGL